MDRSIKKANILIIEDDPFDAENLKLHLQQAGHRIVGVVTTGQAAIEKADTDKIDLMLADIVLPGEIDGIETVRRIHKKHNIPTIFITAYTSDEQLIRAEQVRPFAYLLKPYQQREMEMVINICLARSQVEKELAAQKQQAEEKELRAQKELLKQKELLALILEHIPYAVFWKDRGSNYLGCNSYFVHDTGLDSPADIIGKNDFDLPWSPDEAEYYRQVDLDVMESGKSRLNFEESQHSDDGREITVLTSKVPLIDEDGKIMGILGIYADISERKKQEEQLRHVQKMDALGKLTGGVAHDFNNMLGVVLGYVSLLEEQLADQPKLAKYAHEIHHAGERSAKLTRKLLAFCRQRSSDAEPVNLNMLIREQQDMLEKTLTARVKLVLDLAEDLWPVLLDKGDLEDAIINISINAMHAIKGNGQLTIQTLNEAIDASDAHALQLEPGDYIQLNIRDTGCGMDKVMKEKIFEPFFSTKGEEGTGLGLAQVYGFVERSKGVLKVYSKPDHGTLFSIYFPRLQQREIDDISDLENKARNYQGNETILVIDDEPALLDLTTEILQNHGYKTWSAINAKQAFNILEDEPVDVLLSDIIMPEMDGYELAAIVMEKYPHVKIQLVSGFSDNNHADMIGAELQDKLLQKPYQSQTLLKRIRELLDERALDKSDSQKRIHIQH